MGGRVKAAEKSFKYYTDNIWIAVTKTQHTIFFNYLDRCIKNKVKFNNIAYWWNFLPILKWCPVEGSGVFCSQLIAMACIEAGIIDLGVKYETVGYLDCCDFILVLKWLCCIKPKFNMLPFYSHSHNILNLNFSCHKYFCSTHLLRP